MTTNKTVLKSFLPPFIIWIVCLAFSLTFNYVEGDDSLTILYHLLGTKHFAAMPYSLYNSGVDFLLRFLPSNETFYITFLFIWTGVSCIVSFLLSLLLCDKWFKEYLHELDFKIFALVALSFFFLCPELVFISLEYNPTVIALAPLLIAHTILKFNIFGERNWLQLLITTIFVGYGVSCRWSVAPYILLILIDTTNIVWELNRENIKRFLFRGILFSISIFFFLWLEGITFTGLWQTMKFGTSVISEMSSTSLLYQVATSVTFYSPISALAFLAGMILTFKNKQIRSLNIAVLVIAIIFRSPQPKFTFIILPLFIFNFAIAISMLSKKIKFNYIAAVLLTLSILPWIFGIKIKTTKTSWGPGFEIANDLNVTRKIPAYQESKLSKIFPGFTLGILDGFAIPTMEGPRPIGGYLGIFCLGKWRNFIHERFENREAILSEAIQNSLPIYKIGGTAYLENSLLNRGYTLSFKENIKTNTLENALELMLFKKNDETLKLYHSNKHILNNNLELVSAISNISKEKILIFSNYTSIIEKLKTLNNYQKLSPFTAKIEK